jgi:D-amino-acid dehydrogenase
MKIAVIGAGMAGVAAAHSLAAAGHDVTVLERRSSVAEETSFAPAGLAAPGLAAPWLAAPTGLRARWRGDAGALRRRETGHAAPDPRSADALDRRARALHRLLRAGLERIQTLARQQAMEFEGGRGLLLVFSDAAALEQARRAADWLVEMGETVEWADAPRQREIEPGRLTSDEALPAAHLADARVGNPREWTQLLRTQAQSLGVRFLFHREAVEVVPGRRPVVRHRAAARDGAETAMADEAFEAVVLCAALATQHLLTPLGLKLPWEPVRGWSVTAPLHLRETAPETGPRAAVLEVVEGISIARLGTRLRVAGGYESVPASAAATPSTAPSTKTLQPLYDALDASFPGSVHWPQAQGWQAVRPALVDGLPVVGPSGLEGVWLDTGHGHHGWALSQVAAEALCAMITGVPAEDDVSAMAPHRFA